MKTKAKVFFALLVSIALLITAPGCSVQQTAVSAAPAQGEVSALPPVNLIYYTIGNPDKDLSMVNEALNKLLKERANVTVQYNKIVWGDYGTKISALVNSGSYFDIAFASGPDQGDYAGNAKKGAWLDLTDYLQQNGKGMYQAIDPLFWGGASIDGKIYGVPTNKELAVPEWWMYPKELVDKYHIDISNYRTLESLEPLLKMIQQNEPDYLPMELDQSANNFFALDGYEYIISREIPLMVKSDDSGMEIVNIFDTPIAKSKLNTLRKYYKEGYINEAAAISNNQQLINGRKVFWKQAGGGPYCDVVWSASRGYPVVAQQVSRTMVTTESTRGGLMVVNSHTKYPKECVDFLNLLNTDAEVRNLINYGIEGVHYKLTSESQVSIIDNALYSGVTYTQGNWFVLETTVNDPKDKWDKYKAFNSSAIKSKMLGFTADTSGYSAEVTAITQIWLKYYPCLMTGSVAPDTQLPKFLAELKTAGIDKLQQELQMQLLQWKAKSEQGM